MPAIGDKVKVKIIQEMQGVQMASSLYFEVDDLTGGPTVIDILADVAAFWQIAWRASVSDQFRISCAIWTNYTDPTEPSIPLFLNLAGLDTLSTPHPANTVVWCSRYAIHNVTGKLVRGRVALSGVTHANSRRGRVVDDMELSTIEEFFKEDKISVANGFTLKNQVRYLVSDGPPKVYDQSSCIQAQMQGEFTKLQSRQTDLCIVP